MIRDFHENDFPHCARLVDRVWHFTERFKPANLADIYTKIYTASSLAESNFYRVVEEGGTVKGFLFGKCGSRSLFGKAVKSSVSPAKLFLRFLFLNKVPLKRKLSFLRKIAQHDKNRENVEPHYENEVNLFVVDPGSQGKGYGRTLMMNFIKFCKERKAYRITVETDAESNYGFYEHLGFSLLGTFFSPVQLEYSGTSGESFVYELKL